MSKDNDALIQLFELLESRYAMRIVWALADGHPQTFRLLQDSVGGVTPNTLNTRLKELRGAHLIDHNGSGYLLTPHGAELVRRLADLKPYAGRWQHQQQRQAARADHNGHAGGHANGNGSAKSLAPAGRNGSARSAPKRHAAVRHGLRAAA
ncbi:MAG: helix-turn-helix transcriptional regulator [Hydrogenophaga sp.]|uniref:winged helix-turn-helix transcriptional regulator n=1 Tax=Hydrogenophaga sp. TaxID=1904254 RepID=UPI001DBDFC95|nr:helix-turn-helix transcriptional regulator [Hydrogenophaga sp.]